MSSQFDSNNKNLILSYERQLCSKLNLDIDLINQNNNEIFNNLITNFNINNIKPLYFCNKLLQNISNFNDVCLKYFTILNDSFKFYMNQKITKENNYPVVLILSSLSNFVKIFSSNQEKYNEKHKNILKQFPQFLQLLFKLFQQKYEDDVINNYNNNKKVIESFLILCLSFIEYYPTLMRNYQNIIEKIIKTIFIKYTIDSKVDKKTVNIAIVIYVNLYKLSPNITNRHQDYVLNIINNIKYYLELFRPKTIEEEENNKNSNNANSSGGVNLDQKNNLFNSGDTKNKIKLEENIDSKNLVHADKIMEILFDLLNNIFKYMVCNLYFEVNFNNIFSLFNEILNLYESLDNNKSKSSLSNIIFSGLSKSNYNLFLININESVIDFLKYLISNFSRYIYYYNIFFSKYINKILLNQNFFKNNIFTYKLHIKILSFFEVVISYFSDILPDEIDLIIYNHIYNNLPILYLKYLQQNDRTLLKVDEMYFKASNIKNKIYSYDNDNTNNSLPPKENHQLLLEYFKILYDYCIVTKNIYQLNHKNILGGIIDLVVLPAFAKFIFNIDYDIKKIIIDIIEICLKRNLVYINRYKLYNFLNNFYLYDGNLKFCAEIVMNLLQIKDSELLKGDNYNNENNNFYGGVPNNITQQIFDFNKKIKEYLNDSKKKLEEINLLNNKTKEKKEDLNLNNDMDNDIYYNDKNNEMLNKKRKMEEENELNIDYDDNDKDERKGNKKKSKNTKKGKSKDKNNNITVGDDVKNDNNLKENENKFENEDKEKDGNQKEEDIQIDDNDIDIPDIV